MGDRIANTSVFSYSLVSEVNLAVSINSYVLEECVALDSAVDIGLAFLVEVDNLCLATTFVVEHTVVVPAVFVITDELTLRVGREGSLTST